MIYHPSTQLEADILQKDALVIRAAEATHHLAAVLKAVHQEFWSLPTERLLAVLNSDIASTLEAFEANTTLGTVANANLDAVALPMLSVRAPVAMGRTDITFTGTAFVLVDPEPPAEPE